MKIRNAIKDALKEQRKILLESEAKRLLRALEVPVAPYGVVKEAEEACKVAQKLGYPVVLKVISPDITHKTEAGGVCIDIADEEALKRAWMEMVLRVAHKRPGARIEGFIVEKMIKKGVEIIIGAMRDEQFGPVVMFGTGGMAVELFRDVSYRLAPVSLETAQEMIREPKGFVLLNGYRGAPPCDMEGLAHTVVRVSELLCNLEELEAVEINPLMVYEHGVMAVDAKATLV